MSKGKDWHEPISKKSNIFIFDPKILAVPANNSLKTPKNAQSTPF
jgi:hypothetical protein